MGRNISLDSNSSCRSNTYMCIILSSSRRNPSMCAAAVAICIHVRAVTGSAASSTCTCSEYMYIHVRLPILQSHMLIFFIMLLYDQYGQSTNMFSIRRNRHIVWVLVFEKVYMYMYSICTTFVAYNNIVASSVPPYSSAAVRHSR